MTATAGSQSRLAARLISRRDNMPGRSRFVFVVCSAPRRQRRRWAVCTDPRMAVVCPAGCPPGRLRCTGNWLLWVAALPAARRSRSEIKLFPRPAATGAVQRETAGAGTAAGGAQSRHLSCSVGACSVQSQLLFRSESVPVLLSQCLFCSESAPVLLRVSACPVQSWRLFCSESAPVLFRVSSCFVQSRRLFCSVSACSAQNQLLFCSVSANCVPQKQHSAKCTHRPWKQR